MEAVQLHQYEEPNARFYQELVHALRGVNDFLNANTHTLRGGFEAVGTVIPQVRHLNDSLIYVMNGFRHTIENLDVNQIPNLPELSGFANQVESFLEAAQQLLPEGSSSLSDVRNTTRVMSALPVLDDQKGTVLELVDNILHHLHALKS